MYFNLSHFLITTFILVLILVVWAIFFVVIRVEGESMLPTLVEGDILLGVKRCNKKKLKEGDVVILIPPYDKSIFVVKRITAIKTDRKNNLKFFVEGDNKKVSFDSREYGWVSSNKIVAKVIY